MRAATIQMGEQLKASNGEVIRFSVHLTAVKGAYVEVIEDGRKVALLSDPVVLQDDALKIFDFTCDGSRHWLRINVRTSNGSLLLLGNAVYINF